MSLQDIRIHRDFPIIDGFVQVPPNEETDKTRVTESEALSLITDSETKRLSLGSGRQRGSKYGQQEWIRLPGLRPDEWYSTDPVDDLSSA